jgi:hypothetical protein
LSGPYKGRENPRADGLFRVVWFMPGSFRTVLFFDPGQIFS